MSEDRMEDLYDPGALKRSYDKLSHGKAKAAAIRGAMEAADAHGDTAYRVYFRLELCLESCFYGDSLEMMVIFPEVLAIVDRYPDTPSTGFNREYKDAMDQVLWVYKWILNNCKDFYQIPMSDCMNFFEDFKRRSQAYGYNLRPYYYFLHDFYEKIDPEKAKEAFYAFEKLPRDGNCDCKACERNTVIDFWLKNGEPERAGELAEDIENFTLRCGHDRMASWLRLKSNYMRYHLRRAEFEEAGKYCRILERQTLQDTEFQCWDDLLYCYAYQDRMGKALRIYKGHWKDWLEERNPSEIYDSSINIARFFRKMLKERETGIIMLSLDASFPLYQEDGEYRIGELYRYYYDRAADMAEKFDRRNGSTCYHDRLVEALAMVDRIIRKETDSRSVPAAGERAPEDSNGAKDQIERWIEKLDSGDLTGLKAVYSAFATDDGELIRRAGEAVAGQLRGLQRASLLKLCERFRDFTSLEWFIDWAEVSLDRVRKELPEEAYRYVLILGSFHPNGYFRERCMYGMAECDRMLFWLFFRVNDWVRDIRTAACGVLEVYLQGVCAEELFDSMPAFERLQDCRRRSEEQMEKLWKQIEARMSLACKEMDLDRIPLMEAGVRAALYRVLIHSGTLTIQEMDVILQQEKLSCLKRILIGGILAHPDCTVDRAERYLTDSSAVIRRRAVEFRYERLKTCWPGLEQMLLDSSRGVREYAAYILGRHGSLDIRGYYLGHLGDGKPEYAILGLAEFSRNGNVTELMKCLERPEGKVQKCTLLALGYQEDFTGEEILWQYLLDSRNDLSKAAYLSILKRDFYPGAGRIYDAYLSAGETPRRKYLLNLLLREGSWKRLPYLVRMYHRGMPEEEGRKVLSGIRSRFMYGKISQSLREDILQALEENGRELPDGMEKAVLYDMKHV